MKTQFIIILLSFLCSFTCSKPKPIEEKNITPEWERVIIETKGQVIAIVREYEKSMRDTCDFAPITHEQINKGCMYFNLTKEEKDSIFSLVYKIVTEPFYIEQTSECYTENISISYEIDNTTLVRKYNLVCDWTTISPATKKLKSILRRKAKFRIIKTSYLYESSY